MITSPVQKSKREVFDIKASNAPIGQHPLAKKNKGLAGSYDLSIQSKDIVLHYPGGRLGQELFLIADLYEMPGAPSYILIFCPICQNNLRVSADNKKFEYDETRAPRFKGWSPSEVCQSLGISSLGGTFSTEEIACSWELDQEIRRDFGFAVCPWRAVIENSGIREV